MPFFQVRRGVCYLLKIDKAKRAISCASEMFALDKGLLMGDKGLLMG